MITEAFHWSSSICSFALKVHVFEKKQKYKLGLIKWLKKYSRSRVIRVYGSPEMPNWSQQTIFSPFICRQACVPTSERLHANTFSLAATLKFFDQERVKITFSQINLGFRASRDLDYACRAEWSHYVFSLVFSIHRTSVVKENVATLFCCEGLKNLLWTVQHPTLHQHGGWEDKAWISFFFFLGRTSFFPDGKSRYPK